MANKVRLTICGSSYVISTNESEDYMQNLAERLNLDMNELMSSSNSVSHHHRCHHDRTELPR